MGGRRSGPREVWGAALAWCERSAGLEQEAPEGQ